MKILFNSACMVSLLFVGQVGLWAQTNPVWNQLAAYKSWVNPDPAISKALADNILTWQMPNGGFSKSMYGKLYNRAWDGKEPRSTWIDSGNATNNFTKVDLETIDNDATINEIQFLATVFSQQSDPRYKEAVLRAFDFLLALQYPSGGFAQVLPRRIDLPYSNMVTFNDDAMVRVLLILDLAIDGAAPFGPSFFSPEQVSRFVSARDKGVEYILKSQIVVDGKLTVWCAQHDPVTYAPVSARAYELASKSGYESTWIAAYLMTRPVTPAIQKSVQAAVDWYKALKVVGKTYNKKGPEMFIDDPKGEMWYRFYDLDQDKPFFCGRDGIKKYDIYQIEEERRLGYQWAGPYGTSLLAYAATQGYN